MDNGFKADNGGRRAREQEEGKIWQPNGQHIEFAPTLEWRKAGRSGEYRWIPLEQRVGPERETKDDKKRRELREREDKMIALAREGKLVF